MTKIFTIGYEGADIDDFVETLQLMGIATLLDVREMPISRRKGFSKNKLNERLAEAGIHYRHEKRLGSPKPVRDELKASGNYDQFFHDFGIHLQLQTGLLRELAEELEGSVALMCFERNYRECHRSVVAAALGKLVGKKPKHLGVQGNAQREVYKAALQDTR